MFAQWLEGIASPYGLEVEPTQSFYAEVEQFVRGAGPAILRLPDGGSSAVPRFLVLLKGGWRRASLIGPDLSAHKVRFETLRDALCNEIEVPYIGSIEQLLVSAGVPEHRLDRARRAILNEQLGREQIHNCWLLRLSPGTSLWRQAKHARLHRAALTLVGGHIIHQVLTIIAWLIIGRSALAGHFDQGWLLGWALVLVTSIFFQITLVFEVEDRLAIGVGALFKQRLLYGALRLAPEEVRHQGAGQFLGRVMESEAVEFLALTGGFTAVLSVIQLGVAFGLLTIGAGGWSHALLLLLWLVIPFVVGWRYLKRSRTWVDIFREMTNDLVERMVGHRTRLVQEDPARWHDEEDQILNRYFKAAETRDHVKTQLNALIVRGWMIVGVVGLAFAFVNIGSSPARMAISFGGILLALQGLTTLVPGVQGIADAMVAWRQIGPLFQAASRPSDEKTGGWVNLQMGKSVNEPANEQMSNQADETRGQGDKETRRKGEIDNPQSVIVGRELNFRHRDRGQLILEACSLQIDHGDHLLLEGPSGGGKSTLASLLAGLRIPESGLLLWRGFDRETLGTAAWRRQVVMVPQFHENHVITGTLAFNLLMGRRYPPLQKDLAEAEAVCRELGLGELLDQMPAGMQQMVGESGWRLSHGERSRLYIARAILQGADLVILDESFGALDPENLHRALRCVLDRAPTLLVIAHP
jgi:ATP-binding cassette subfamily B protein